MASQDNAPSHGTVVDDATRERLAPWNPLDRVSSWYWTGIVTLLALATRMINVQFPPQIIFDETYYANDAKALLERGYEHNLETGEASIAAHPPWGKWCIAFGEWLFGYNSLGWRFSAALAGALSILLIIRIGRRLFRSTLLGCIAGVLLTIEGLHFTSSRIALLDIFLLLFVLIAFGCILMDREQRRAQLLAQLERGARMPGREGWREWPWWRFAAAVSLGLALSVKWSAVWFVIIFVVFIVVWEVQARRSAGAARPILETIGWETGWLVVFGLIILATYVATFAGWFISDDAAFRNWAAENDGSVILIPDAIVNLWQYEAYIFDFHANLAADHPYKSDPWTWLWMERPVLYYTDYDGDCGESACAASISGMGNPLLWWSFVPALLVCAWRWIAHRDWRGGAILLPALAGVLPWFAFPDRTQFFFYILPSVPFFILAVTLALGMLLGRDDASAERRMFGAGTVVVYIVIVAMSFAYFAPLMTGIDLPRDEWDARWWFDSWI